MQRTKWLMVQLSQSLYLRPVCFSDRISALISQNWPQRPGVGTESGYADGPDPGIPSQAF